MRSAENPRKNKLKNNLSLSNVENIFKIACVLQSMSIVIEKSNDQNRLEKKGREEGVPGVPPFYEPMLRIS